MAKHEELKNVLTIDPGFQGTGWAYWNTLAAGSLEPNASGHFKPRPGRISKADPVLPRVIELTESFKGLLSACARYEAGLIKLEECPIIPMPNCEKLLVYIEYQEVYGGSAKSHASAVKGDLTKLTLLTGFYAHAAIEAGATVCLIPPSQWKGQLSKKATALRLNRAFGKKVEFNNHTADAVGIGLALIGRF